MSHLPSCVHFGGQEPCGSACNSTSLGHQLGTTFPPPHPPGPVYSAQYPYPYGFIPPPYVQPAATGPVSGIPLQPFASPIYPNPSVAASWNTVPATPARLSNVNKAPTPRKRTSASVVTPGRSPIKKRSKAAGTKKSRQRQKPPATISTLGLSASDLDLEGVGPHGNAAMSVAAGQTAASQHPAASSDLRFKSVLRRTNAVDLRSATDVYYFLIPTSSLLRPSKQPADVPRRKTRYTKEEAPFVACRLCK
jgi:hypothetical protein